MKSTILTTLPLLLLAGLARGDRREALPFVFPADAITSGGGTSASTLAGEFSITASVGEIAGDVAKAGDTGFSITSGFPGSGEVDDGIADSWQTRYGLTTLIAGRDPDRDGLDDYAEAALNLNPNKADADSAVTASVVKSGAQSFLEIKYRRHTGHAPGKFTLAPERSSQLSDGTWSAAGFNAPSSATVDAETELITVRVTAPIPATVKPREFARLRITFQP